MTRKGGSKPQRTGRGIVKLFVNTTFDASQVHLDRLTPLLTLETGLLDRYFKVCIIARLASQGIGLLLHVTFEGTFHDTSPLLVELAPDQSLRYA